MADDGSAFVAALMFFLFLFMLASTVLFWTGGTAAEQKMYKIQTQAVERGYAEWYGVQSGPETKWRWKEQASE